MRLNKIAQRLFLEPASPLCEIGTGGLHTVVVIDGEGERLRMSGVAGGYHRRDEVGQACQIIGVKFGSEAVGE